MHIFVLWWAASAGGLKVGCWRERLMCPDCRVLACAATTMLHGIVAEYCRVLAVPTILKHYNWVWPSIAEYCRVLACTTPTMLHGTISCPQPRLESTGQASGSIAPSSSPPPQPSSLSLLFLSWLDAQGGSNAIQYWTWPSLQNFHRITCRICTNLG